MGVELLWWGLLLFDSLLFADPQSLFLSSTTISTFNSPREGHQHVNNKDKCIEQVFAESTAAPSS